MSKVEVITVHKDDVGIRLDRWFSRYYPHVTHGTIEKALRKGQIRVNGKKITAGYRMAEGEQVRVPPFKEQKTEPVAKKIFKRPGQDDIALLREAILFEDEAIIVLNKPSGIPVQGGTGITQSIDRMLPWVYPKGQLTPRLVHRLDKDTSGILVVAKTPAMAAVLAEAFRQKKIEKHYWALVVGVPEQREGVITLRLKKTESGPDKEKVEICEDGETAITCYRVRETIGRRLAWVEFTPKTGRTHQLRVHAMSLGTPILGDRKYGGSQAVVVGMSSQLHLHARQLTLPDTVGKYPSFVAPLSGHMKKTFNFLELREE